VDAYSMSLEQHEGGIHALRRGGEGARVTQVRFYPGASARAMSQGKRHRLTTAVRDTLPVTGATAVTHGAEIPSREPASKTVFSVAWTKIVTEGVERMRADGSKLTGRVQAVVTIEVRDAAPLVSPAYDDGVTTESDMLETLRARFARLHDRHVRG
jgi:hypothetical protein